MRQVYKIVPFVEDKPNEFSWRKTRIRVEADHTSAVIYDRFEDTLPVYLTAQELDELAGEWLAWRKAQWLLQQAERMSATVVARIEAARGS